MLLNAIVLSGDVVPSTFYDQLTGVEKLDYTVELSVLDADTDEKYTVQVASGFGRLDEIKLLRRQGQPNEVLSQMADQLRQELPPKMSPVALEVLKLKGKSAAFLKLVCRLAQVG